MKNPPQIESQSDTVPVLAVTPFRADHDALEQMLPASRWTLHSARTVSSAVAQLRKLEPFPLVLCDSDVWPGSWREMLQHVLGMSRPPVLIVASRFADEQLWAEALNLGAYDVLAKPFHATEVERSLSSAWLRWRLSDAAGPCDMTHAAERKGAAKATSIGAGHVRPSDPNMELLVVEPNVSQATSILEALAETGLNQVIVVIQDEALMYLRREDEYQNAPVPDLILLDCGLDQPSIRGVLKEIRTNSHLAGIPAVVLAPSEHPVNPHEAAALGASSVIVRPNGRCQFVQLCEAALSSGRGAVPSSRRATSAS
jgi:DNA-binding response OmpR family regulator